MADHKFGVVYTPANVDSPSNQTFDLLDDAWLDALGVKFIRITWSDYINNIRYRVVPRKYFKKLLHSSRPGVSITKACFGLVFLALAPNFTGTGEYLYVIDQSSFRVSPYAPGHASVFGFFQEKEPHPQYGLEVPLCPRKLLKDIVERAESQARVSYLVGFESEFILLSQTSPQIVPVNRADWSVSSKLPSGSVEAKVMEEIAECLIEAGIEVQMYHAEAAPGQYEIVTGPLPPLQSADALITTRETIYNVASKHGLRATFAPRLYTTSTGSGAHTNISVHDIDGPSTKSGDDAHFGPTMRRTERSFVQGVLDHVPALCAFTLPTKYSYTRVGDGVWSGGTYASWGTDNRECPIRRVGNEDRYRYELRFVDGTANPHVVLAGILGAATQALVDGAPLRSGDCPKSVAVMSEEEKETIGVKDVGRVPLSLEQARKNLDADKGLRKILGDFFVSTYLDVNATLETLLVGENEEDTVTKLVNFY